MSDLSALKTAITTITGKSGTDYSTLMTDGVNWAIGQINTVKWRIAWAKTTLSINVATGAGPYSLTGGIQHLDRFYINDVELIEAIPDDILRNSVTAGTPTYFATAGNSNTQLQLYVGLPTTNDTITVDYSYYKRFTELSVGTDESDISKAYKDDPIIAGAAYYVLYAIDDPRVQIRQAEFSREMANMEESLDFDGERYVDVLREQTRP